MIGKTVSHFRIIEELGSGGMGIVYKAEDTKLRRTVALKLLPAGLTRTDEAKKRFVHEAQAASALQHNNICTIHEIDETPEGQLFICMDCYEGDTLEDKISTGPMPVADAVDAAIQVGRGMAKAHQQGLIHRDIKPANVVVTTDGVVKIVDFGLAKLAGQTKVTRDGTTVGTVAYMSPEQALGETVDHRTDIWSLGVVLHEMLTGRAPFQGDRDAAITYQIVHESATSVSAQRPEVPARLERIVNRCMEKKASARYQSMDELLRDIEEFVQPARPKRWRSFAPLIPIAIAAIAIVLVAAWKPELVGLGPGTDTANVEMAVLHFVNQGHPEDEYFAGGVTDEIISKLAVIQGLSVISRTSSIRYKDSDLPLRKIGEELGVDYILEGTIRWDRTGEKQLVRITPQLIRVSDDRLLWAGNYERAMTQVFVVQTDIASRIAVALGVTLLDDERRSIERAPTGHMEAYQAYLRGREITWASSVSQGNIELGIQMYERAVELDPGFALSYAALSRAHSGMYHFGYDRSEGRLARARAAADRALELEPRLPEARLAMAYYYYWGRRDHERALEELAIAGKIAPNDARVLEAIGFVRRRQGNFAAAAKRLEEAYRLNPRDALLTHQMASTYMYLRRYGDADAYYDTTITLAPDAQYAYANRAENYRAWTGNLLRSREILERMPRAAGDTWRWVDQWWFERDYDAIVEFASVAPEEMMWRQDWALPHALLCAFAYTHQKKPALAQVAYKKASAVLEKELANNPEDYRLHSSLGLSYAGLGRAQPAIASGRRGVELCPVAEDALVCPLRVKDLAVIYVMCGEFDAAVKEIEFLLSNLSLLSVPLVRMDPWWDPLRDHPGFRALVSAPDGS